MARIYLAGRYSRRVELCGYADDLRTQGHTITARWLTGFHQLDDNGLSAEASAAERQRFAEEDWEDVITADVVISFTESPRATGSRGRRHVEYGAALALRKLCIIIGPQENVFHCLACVTVFETWEALRKAYQFSPYRVVRNAGEHF